MSRPACENVLLQFAINCKLQRRWRVRGYALKTLEMVVTGASALVGQVVRNNLPNIMLKADRGAPGTRSNQTISAESRNIITAY